MKEISSKQWAKFNGRKLPVRPGNKVHTPKTAYDRRNAEFDIEEGLEEYYRGQKRNERKV